MSKNKIKIEDLNVESKKEEKNTCNETLNSKSENINLISPNSMPKEIMNEFAENFYNSQQISK